MIASRATAEALSIRDAAEADLPAIAAILNREIARSTGSWTTTPKRAAEMRLWFVARRAAGLPVLVAEAAGGAMAGYAALGPFRSGEGYSGVAETSVYVAEGFRGRGAGRALLAALVAAAPASGLAHLVAGIGADNAASLALHRAQGFAEAGRLPGIGRKFGRSLDLVLLLKRL